MAHQVVCMYISSFIEPGGVLVKKPSVSKLAGMSISSANEPDKADSTHNVFSSF